MNAEDDFDAGLRRVVQSDVDAHPVPSGLADRLLADARRSAAEPVADLRRRGHVLIPLLAAVAILAIAGVALLVGLGHDRHGDQRPAASSPTAAAPTDAVATPDTPPAASSAADSPSTTPAATSVAAAPGAHSPTECSKSTLAVAVTAEEPAMHNFAFALHFTNTSSTPCTIQGYPGVAVLNSQGTQLAQANRTVQGFMGGLTYGDKTPPSISLTPGAEATALLEGGNTYADGTPCPTVSGLLVTVPDDTASTELTAAVPYCSASVQIHPVVAGATGSNWPGTSGSIADCVTSGLKFSFSSLGGAAGTGYFAGFLTNTAASSCILYGFPTLQAVDAAGQAVLNPAAEINQVVSHGGTSTSNVLSAVTLKPGDRGEFLISFSDVVPGPGCQTVTTAAGLRVTPPNQATSITQPGTIGACDLRVGAVAPAS